MYCNNCGEKLGEVSKFCSKCGNPTEKIVSNNNVLESQDKISQYSFYLSIITSPIMFIIRMLAQEQKVGYGWREYTYYTVPGNIRAIMIVLTVILLGTSILLETKNKLKHEKLSKKMIISCIISAILSMIIIFWE